MPPFLHRKVIMQAMGGSRGCLLGRLKVGVAEGDVRTTGPRTGEPSILLASRGVREHLPPNYVLLIGAISCLLIYICDYFSFVLRHFRLLEPIVGHQKQQNNTSNQKFRFWEIKYENNNIISKSIYSLNSRAMVGATQHQFG